jgi:nitrogen fixation NifU-like protein
VTPEKIIAYLETIPESHHHCAELAVGALYRALADLRAKQQQPWRKMYSKDGSPLRNSK